MAINISGKFTPTGPFTLLDKENVTDDSSVGMGVLLATDEAVAQGVLGQRIVRNAVKYGMSTGGTAAANTTALAAAIAATGDDEVLYIPAGTFTITANSASLILTRSLTISGVPGQSILQGDTQNRGLQIKGVIGSQITTLAQNAYAGSTTFEVASAAGLSVGQWIRIRDTRSWATWNLPTQVWEEKVKIESISGTTVTVHRTLLRSYSVLYSASIYAVTTAAELYLQGLVLNGCGLYCEELVRARLTDVSVINSDVAAMQFIRCNDLRVFQCSAESPTDKVSSGKGYGFSFESCTDVVCDEFSAKNVKECTIGNGSRLVTISNGSFLGCTFGPNAHGGGERNVLFANNRLVNSYYGIGDGADVGASDIQIIGGQVINNRTGVPAVNGCGSTITGASCTLSTTSHLMTCTGSYLEHGQAIQIWGTMPTSWLAYEKFYAVAPLANTCAVSRIKPHPAYAAAYDYTTQSLTMQAGAAQNDAVVLHTIDAPAGVPIDRQLFLRQRTGNYYLLQRTRSGQVVTWNVGAGTCTIGSFNSEWADGDCIAFYGGTLPTEVTQYTPYYLRDGSGGTFKLATAPGGAAITLSGSPAATTYAVCGAVDNGSGIYVEAGACLTIGGSPASNHVRIPNSNLVVSDVGFINCEGRLFDITGTVDAVVTNNTVNGHKLTAPVALTATQASHVLFGRNHIRSGRYTFKGAILTDANEISIRDNTFDVPNASAYNLITGSGSNINAVRVIGNRAAIATTRAKLIDSTVPLTATARVENNEYATYREGSGQVQDAGNASIASAIPGTTANVIRYNVAIDADRYVDLDDTVARIGDWIEVVRTTAATGAFKVDVRNKTGSTVLFTFSAAPQSGFVRFYWSGTAWVQGASYLV